MSLVKKVVCEHCGWKGPGDDQLTAVSPFDPDDNISGCPACKGIDCCLAACDEPGCWRSVTCGTSTPLGYRHTCSRHKPAVEAAKAAGGEL